jgi:hypothetical protein
MVHPVVESNGQGITDGWVRLPEDVLGEVAIAAAGGGGDTGQNVVVVWLPDSQRTIVVASSSDGVDAESLLQVIGPALVKGLPIPHPDSTREVDDDELAAAAGTYALDTGGRLDVSVGSDGQLLVAPEGVDAVAALRPLDAATTEEIAAHEQAVLDLLSGRTDVGRDELATLAESYGDPIEVDLLGSAIEERELRTYVRIRFADESVAGWYALNSAGGIEGVDIGGPPRSVLVAVAGGFHVAGAPASSEAVTVTFDDDAMTIDRGDGAPLAATREEA